MVAIALSGAMTCPAMAGTTNGKVIFVEGHISSSCRILAIDDDTDHSIKYYRLPDTGADNSMMAVAMLAFSLQKSVTVVFADGGTTGCGTEPRVDYLRLAR